MITPVTKRIGIICITVINIAAIVSASLGEVPFDSVTTTIVIPSMTGLFALINDGA